VTANKLPSVKNADGQQLAYVYYESVRSDDADFHLSSNFDRCTRCRLSAKHFPPFLSRMAVALERLDRFGHHGCGAVSNIRPQLGLGTVLRHGAGRCLVTIVAPRKRAAGTDHKHKHKQENGRDPSLSIRWPSANGRIVLNTHRRIVFQEKTRSAVRSLARSVARRLLAARN